MTPAEWQSSADAVAMLAFLKSHCSGWAGSDFRTRKLCLWACACCREVWHLLHDDCQCAIESLEYVADTGKESVAGKH